MALVPSDSTRRTMRERRRAAQGLMVSYLQAKALAELLATLNRPQDETGFQDQERAAVRAAHQQAVAAFEALDVVICDQGNALGLSHLRSLLET